MELKGQAGRSCGRNYGSQLAEMRAPGGVEGTGERNWPELRRSKHLETLLDLAAEGGPPCHVLSGDPPEIRKKPGFQIGWVRKTLTLDQNSA